MQKKLFFALICCAMIFSAMPALAVSSGQVCGMDGNNYASAAAAEAAGVDVSYEFACTNHAAEDCTYENNYKCAMESVERGIQFFSRISGRIILRVEKDGQAYYVPPVPSGKMGKFFYLGRPDDAFNIMRGQGVGISNKNLEKIPVADDNCPSYVPKCNKIEAHDISYAKKQNGKIFLQVENNGEAWYVHPVNSKRYYLGRPEDAFNIMRNLGLGVSEADAYRWLQ
ncbi:MAG: hypothetical protein Q8N21_03650 [bacterium]|nr:hypothetical protein [bacterium]